jgi:hypothetical protein
MEKGLGAHFQPSFPEFGPPAMYDYDMVVIGSGPSDRRAERSEAIQCHYAVL